MSIEAIEALGEVDRQKYADFLARELLRKVPEYEAPKPEISGAVLLKEIERACKEIGAYAKEKRAS